MNKIGEKVLLRDRQDSDYVLDGIWEHDEEVKRENPAVGGPYNDMQKFSIDSLDGVHIGTCSLYDHTMDDVQLGIQIGNKDYWSRGYGTDAVKILLDYAFNEMYFQSVWLKVLPTNLRAIRCYEKSGFVKTGWISLGGYSFMRMECKKEL